MKVAVLGGGSWGTTVASLLARNTPTILWARSAATADEINAHHSNKKYLPAAQLNPELRATDDIEQAVTDRDLLVMAIPAQNFRAVLKQTAPHLKTAVPVVSLTKGLEADSHLRMSEIIRQELPGHPVAVLTGPNLAPEIIAGRAAASVVAADNPPLTARLQSLFQTGMFRVYTNQDLIGCELGGVLKNIIAIAAGMGDGLGAGDNTRAAVITRGLAEISRLGVAMGGQFATFSGLAGMGDLVATCTSAKSRNRSVGYHLGQGRSLEEIDRDMHMVAEGVKSAPAVMELAAEYGIDMPIAREVYQVVRGQSKARFAYRGLVRIVAGAESQPG